MLRSTLLFILINAFQSQNIKIETIQMDELKCENPILAKQNFAEICELSGLIDEYRGRLSPWNHTTCGCVADGFTVEDIVDHNCRFQVPMVLMALERTAIKSECLAQ